MEEGYCEGEICNREGCLGTILEHDIDGCCSCHLHPPCGYCTEPKAYCNKCGWDLKEEQDEEYINQQKSYKIEQHKREKDLEIFRKKWLGEIPADKLEIKSKSHTHFSMIKYGVFPKGSETKESLRPKVNGTFGGRFTTHIDEESFRFEFIAYTD